MNTFGDTLPATDAATVLFILLAAGVIIYEKMWKRLPPQSNAAYWRTLPATVSTNTRK